MSVKVDSYGAMGATIARHNDERAVVRFESADAEIELFMQPADFEETVGNMCEAFDLVKVGSVERLIEAAAAVLNGYDDLHEGWVALHRSLPVPTEELIVLRDALKAVRS